MPPRPEAIGLNIVVKTIDDVDPILHELAWLQNEKARLDAIVREKTDAITKEHEPKYSLLIEGQSVTIAKRTEDLTAAVKPWIVSHIAKHFVGKKRSIDKAHGTVGLRQIPMVIELKSDTSEEKVLEAVDGETDGIVATIRGWGIKKLKSFGCLVGDVLTVKASLNLAGIKKAFDQKRLTKEQIESIGLVIREAKDDATIKPNQLTVSNE